MGKDNKRERERQRIKEIERNMESEKEKKGGGGGGELRKVNRKDRAIVRMIYNLIFLLIEQKDTTFDHYFGYSFPFFSSLLKTE